MLSKPSISLHNGEILSPAKPTLHSSKRKSQRRRKRKSGKTVVSNTTTSFPGVVAMQVPTRMSRSLRPFVRGHVLGVRGTEFVNRHCNPNGEMVTHTENCKVPDGALPNSAAIGLREVFIVRSPISTASTIDLQSGDMWTLTVIHTPMFRTPLLMVASMNNAELTDNDQALLTKAWNTIDNPTEYPEWTFLTGGTYWTTAVWSALKGIPTPGENGASTTISQFRICADGMTIFNNTPDLINQGMVVGAQWNTNQAERVFKPDLRDGVALQNLSATLSLNGSPSPTSGVLNAQFPGGGTSGIQNLIATANFASTNNTNVQTTTATADFRYRGVTVTTGDLLTLQLNLTLTSNNAYGWTVTFSVTPEGGTITPMWVWNQTPLILVSNRYTQVFDYGVLEAATEVVSVTKWDLPPLTTESIIQSTPKAVYMSMKEQNGVYMVKRVFQPVWNVAEASSYRRVRMLSESDDTEASTYLSGKFDTFDLNFSTGVVVMTSIPIACAPAFKLMRDIEVVANEDSIWQPFMASNEDPIPPALDIVRSISIHHPFLYPESYNSLGGLMGILARTVSKIPIIGSVFPVVSDIVKNLFSKEQASTPTSGASQNRLASLNVDELAKLAEMLFKQLGI